MHLLIRKLTVHCGRLGVRTIFSVSSVWDPKITTQTKFNIEDYWRGRINDAPNRHLDPSKKMYVLSMFPYPSGQLHLGHVRVYTISDTYARLYKMLGKHVIHPMGWDSFGLPAENAAVERNEDPRNWTEKNIDSMKKQLKDMNFNFDWEREISTCDPNYYKWTQYLFLKLYEKGLVYRKNSVVHWDPVDRTVLADEQVDAEGRSWRSGAKVEKKTLRQWFVRTTFLSKDLLLGLEDPTLRDWDEVLAMQRGWIGECTGFAFSWPLYADDDAGSSPTSDFLPIWTEHPELLAGVAFVAVSPDHLLAGLSPGKSGSKSARGRPVMWAGNPVSGRRVPVLVSDMFEYPRSTQSHLGIPSLSKEDQEFAKQHGIDTIRVIDADDHHLVNSGDLTGLSRKDARAEVCRRALEAGQGGYPCSPILRDWLISRQRYWGTPIPVVHCPSCNVVPVPYEQLPVELPPLDLGKASARSGLSPLSAATDWLNVPCPRCGGPAQRETDTMDTFVDSSWYYLRFLDPGNKDAPVDGVLSRDLLPVDLYIGGVEHAVMHLYYARFMSHFLHSLGLTRLKEPFQRMLVHGMVVNETFRLKDSGQYLPKDAVEQKGSKFFEKETGKPVSVDWEKMSKSKHNGVRPEDIVSKYGIDTTRLFILSAYSPTSRYKWPSETFRGVVSWQERLWLTVHDFRMSAERSLEEAQAQPDFAARERYYYEGRNYTVKNVSFKYNVTRQLNLVIKDLQIYTKHLRYKNRGEVVFGRQFERALAALIVMLGPLAPHFASEMWAGFADAARFRDETGYSLDKPLMEQSWPEVDMDYNLDFLVKANDMDLLRIQLPRHRHDALTKETAYQMAIESESLRHRLQKWPKFQVVFDHQPSYKAELRFISQGKPSAEVQERRHVASSRKEVD
ncbi:putative leucine--tRNA ligase, mitochondrial [Ixodes scapularis]